MTLREFIKTHRTELDKFIKGKCPNVGTINDEERRLWVLNDEALYCWARAAGVKV